LVETDIATSQVSDETGFPDHSYLGKQFLLFSVNYIPISEESLPNEPSLSISIDKGKCLKYGELKR
jgi:hypothetical protein